MRIGLRWMQKLQQKKFLSRKIPSEGYILPYLKINQTRVPEHGHYPGMMENSATEGDACHSPKALKYG